MGSVPFVTLYIFEHFVLQTASEGEMTIFNKDGETEARVVESSAHGHTDSYWQSWECTQGQSGVAPVLSLPRWAPLWARIMD